MSSPDASGSRAQRLWYEVFAVLCIGILPPVYSALQGFAGEPPPQQSLRAEYLYFLLNSIFVAVPVLYLIEHSRDGVAAFGLKPVRPLFDPVVGAGLWALAWGIALVASWILAAVAPDGIGPSVEREASRFPHDAGDWLLHVLSCAGIGFSEELVRAYLIVRLVELLRSRVLAVVLSAAAFASYHLYQGVEHTLILWVMGLWFGWSFSWLRRVWPLAFGHALWDAWVLGFDRSGW
jgi:membrane protease YdiL (CAAX protease family)